MNTIRVLAPRAAVLFLALSPLLKADIILSLGNTSPGFLDGSHPGSATVLGALTGSAPFNAVCGSDATLNCSTNWTFNYSVPGGQTITGATLALGIYDIDSAAAGNQVATYSLTGGDNLTAALNSVAEGLNGGTGATNSEFDVLTVSIPSTSFVFLQGGTAQISLALQAPGLGALGATTKNGAALIYSTLDLKTSGTVAPVPEPAGFSLVLTAMGAVVALAVRRKVSDRKV